MPNKYHNNMQGPNFTGSGKSLNNKGKGKSLSAEKTANWAGVPGKTQSPRLKGTIKTSVKSVGV